MSTTAESYLVGLIGDGVAPSLTPAMHEAEADAHGLRYLYRPVDLGAIGRPAEDVGELLRAGRDLGFNAFNITHPCKQLALGHLDSVSPAAERLGAVNTVLVGDGGLHGENTDYSGFSRALAEGLPGVELGRVVQFGAGGAGAAVAYALLDSGVRHLSIVDPDRERAGERVAALAGHFPDRTVELAAAADVPALLAEADGIQQCTPVGMHHHPGTPFDPSLLEARHWVSDVIYRPVETELVAAARAAGCRVLDGGHMAVGQAVDAFRLITGTEPDAARMREHFLGLLAAGR